MHYFKIIRLSGGAGKDKALEKYKKELFSSFGSIRTGKVVDFIPKEDIAYIKDMKYIFKNDREYVSL